MTWVCQNLNFFISRSQKNIKEKSIIKKPNMNICVFVSSQKRDASQDGEKWKYLRKKAKRQVDN